MEKIIRKYIKEQIKSLHEGRRVVKIYQSWKKGEKANLNDLGEGNYGGMYFNDTLNDWARFDITKRTKHDATISSGLAVMACNRHLYTPHMKTEKESLGLNIAKYDNKGFISQIIK